MMSTATCSVRGACVLAVLLACAAAASHQTYSPTFLAPGVCPTIDIRSTVEQLQKLRGCRVVEGQLSIVLLERASAKDYQNISFPELREVTGYIKIYRIVGLRNLGDLFPNLTVVRGMQLFKDYALVVFDNENLESIGLRSLTKIERGAVRIQHNDRMCYTNTIDWRRIISPGFEDNNIIRNNYDTRLCGLCPYAQGRNDEHRQASVQCPFDTEGRLLCWDDKHCQKVCKGTCGDSGCLRNGECCHHACLGGCSGPSADDCYVCRHFSFLEGPKRKCVEKCPPTLLELNRRCVTESECRRMPPPLTENTADRRGPTGPNVRSYKIFNNTSCVYQCPSGYMEDGDAVAARCVPCPDKGCTRECNGGMIDSVASAEQFRGCTHIKTYLEISLRASGGNTMTVLESSLGEIREIKDYLKVTRSYPLVSLMFLKNLEKIGGVSSESKGTQSLHIFKNPNLELLWDWPSNKTIEITRGKVFIHYNPKLCYDQIKPLMNMTKDPMATFTESEVSTENNGDQAPCYQSLLQLKVHMLHRKVVFLTWNMYCMQDIRKLLGYSIYYIVADHNVTLYGQRDACSDSWNVLDITMDDVRNNTRLTDPNPLDNPCNDTTLQQPLFYPLSQLIPSTRYAAYVKTYTTLQDRKGAQSPIIYFTTLPGRPSPPASVLVESGTHHVYIRWLPPRTPNGTIETYYVGIQANAYNKPKILQYDKYCTNPSALATMISVSKDDVKEPKESITRNNDKEEQCACKANEKPGSKFSSRAEEEQVDSIYFENELQNMVYIKQSNRKGNNTAVGQNRSRRSTEGSQPVTTTNSSSMLVVLAESKSPMLGINYDNVTDEKGYMKSVYYQFDGKTNRLIVNNMRHFTWYTVNVWACREKHPNETEDDYYDSWCSERAYNIFRTLELVNADAVSSLQAEVLSSNKSIPEVNVTWQPPTNPNGFVLAYTVHHWRVDDSAKSQDVGLQSCITTDEYDANHHGYLLRNLPPGNYGFTVTPITVSGAGNVSDAIFITIHERPSTASQQLIWGLISGCLVMLALLGAGVWYARRGVLAQTEASKLIASVNPEYVSTVYVPDDWEVPRSNIEFIKELGQGSFGMVYEGLAKNIEKGKRETKCAIKTVNEHATERERIEFLNEASVMKAFDTHHVVRLLGVVSQGQPTLVVMELMDNGDLKTYLRSHRPDADGSLPKKRDVKINPPTLQNILQMAIEIADGMAYLSAKKFVHRDLAARNCMVAADLTVKVGDFGMTRDIYETDYYRKGTKGLLPVRWMSPESLKDGIFSSSSDVWSYGVVLWEMATLAMQPYQGLSNEQVLRYVVEGGVMERPEHCPDRLYDLMRQCWAHRSSNRPTFLRLVADLATNAGPHFRQRSFFHSTMGQELYARQSTEDELELPEVNVGAMATASGSNLFGVSGRLASWVRELSSLRSRADDDAAAEPLQPRVIPLNATAVVAAATSGDRAPKGGLPHDADPC